MPPTSASTTDAIRVMIVDDHPAIRQGVTSMLEDAAGIAVVGEADSAATAIERALVLKPDVIILDNRLPGSSGIQVARRLRTTHPKARLVFLTSYDEPEHVAAAIEVGADAYLLKTVGAEDLEAAIRAVHAGERLVSRELLTTVLDRFEALARERTERDTGLTTTEIQLLRLMADGVSNRDIAERCYWSEVTVKRKSREIYRKLGVEDRVQAVVEAFRRGLV